MVPDSRIRVLEITHVDTAVGKPGVVDENVDWSKRSLGTVDAIAHGSQVGDVEIDSLCLYANGSDLSRARLGAIEMQVVDDEVGAGLGQLLRDPQANASAGTSDQGDPALESSHTAS